MEGQTDQTTAPNDRSALGHTGPELSLVIPVYNEEECLELLYDRLLEALGRLDLDCEILFVDDGSVDGSWQLIQRLHGVDSRVRGLRMSRNFGHQYALKAGLDASRGRAVLTMDADLQHPPEKIEELVRRWREGNEIVYTVRSETEGVGFLKRLSSRLFYSLVNLVADVPVQPGAADFRLLDRRVVDELRQFGESQLFLRGLIQWLGFRSVAVPYVAGKRSAGSSSYTPRKMMSLAVSGVMSSSIKPLRLAFLIGAITSMFTGMYIVWILYLKLFTSEDVAGWASILVSVLFLGSVQLLSTGLLGEYLGRVYLESKQRPLYVIRDRVGAVRDRRVATEPMPQTVLDESSR